MNLYIPKGLPLERTSLLLKNKKGPVPFYKILGFIVQTRQNLLQYLFGGGTNEDIKSQTSL